MCKTMHCHFLDIVDDVLKDIPIDVEAKIFELGCGTGAVLKRIRQIYDSDVIIGGSDLSYNAIEVARKTFPEESNHFYVISMTDKNNFVTENTQDIVISFGAFAMYLYKDDMELALIEALRYLAVHCEHFWFQKWAFNNWKKIARFSSFLPNFCNSL